MNSGSLGHSLGSYPLCYGHCRCSSSGSCGCLPSSLHAEDGSCVRAVAQLSSLPSGCDAGFTQPCNLIPARHEMHRGDWAEFLGLCVCVSVQVCLCMWSSVCVCVAGRYGGQPRGRGDSGGRGGTASPSKRKVSFQWGFRFFRFTLVSSLCFLS